MADANPDLHPVQPEDPVRRLAARVSALEARVRLQDELLVAQANAISVVLSDAKLSKRAQVAVMAAVQAAHRIPEVAKARRDRN